MNIFSMTGFGSIESNTEKLALTVDLRAVNHRFLDMSFKLPDELRQLEPVLRERIARNMKRGKIDCRLQLTQRHAADTLMPDSAQIETLLAAEGAVLAIKPDARSLSVADILRWPGVLTTVQEAPDRLAEVALAAFDTAWREFAASRAREGLKLGTVLLENCTAIENLVARIMPRIPEIHEAYKERLAQRLRDARLDPDEERLKQELALFAVRIDINEEVDRLTAHVAEIRRVTRVDVDDLAPISGQSHVSYGSRGKRLDFLVQELHREANTLGAKSIDTELSQIALEIKVLIEQMREQIQNIE